MAYFLHFHKAKIHNKIHFYKAIAVPRPKPANKCLIFKHLQHFYVSYEQTGSVNPYIETLEVEAGAPFTQPMVAQLTTKVDLITFQITQFSTAQLGAIDQSKELSIPQPLIAELQLIVSFAPILPLCKLYCPFDKHKKIFTRQLPDVSDVFRTFKPGKKNGLFKTVR
jgi:hypothetical protein